MSKDHSGRPTAAAAPPTPLFWLAGGLLVGQGAAVAVHSTVAPVGMLVATLVAACLAWLHPRHRALLAALAGALLAAAAGYWQVDRVLRPTFPGDHVRQQLGQRVMLRGRIADRPVRRPGKMRIVVEVAALRRGGDWQAAQGRVLITLLRPTQTWRRGDAIEATLTPRQPRNFGNPGEFDFEAYLARRAIYVTAFAASDASWTRSAAVPGWDARLEAWRDAITRCIESTLEPPAAAIAAALLVGDAIPLEAEVRERYARAGVSHVLSISGLHIGLVAGAAYVLMRWLFARSERLLLFANVPKIATLASLLPLALYALIAGANIATVRAEIMALLVVGALLLDRTRDWLAPLAAAAIAISLYWPGALAEIAFQLSFLAVLAIVLGMRRITAWWNGWEEEHLVRLRGRHWVWIRWLVLSEAVTVCAALGTAPLTAWHFNQISLIGLVANPLIVPLLGLVAVVVGLIATGAVAIAPAIAPPLFVCVGWLVSAADALVRLCAAVPGAALQVATPTLVELALAYAALAAVLLRRRAARHLLLGLCACALAADAAYWAAPSRGLRITFLSVGQGDCTVVEFPGTAVMVVDGGGLFGDFDVGRQVVAPFLWRRKIDAIELLVLSHADFDHFGGLRYLAEGFAPRAFWFNGQRGSGARFAALEQALRETSVPMRAMADGAHAAIGGVEIRVLHPQASAAGSDNDRSLVLQLRYGPTTVLLAGDLEADGERALLAAHGAALRSTILKVPHHGSRTSSTAALLDAVRPQLAIISAGADNRFGFPHANVVDAYRRRGIALRRTDRDGAVTLRITRDGAITVGITRGDAARVVALTAFQPRA